MSDFRRDLEKQMDDKEFRKEWQESETEYSLIRSIIAVRKSRHMTQKELAETTGIDQSDISKIETGNANPALSTRNLQGIVGNRHAISRQTFLCPLELFRLFFLRRLFSGFQLCFTLFLCLPGFLL